MTHVTCRLTAKNQDQFQNPTLGNRVWATFTFLKALLFIMRALPVRLVHDRFESSVNSTSLSSWLRHCYRVITGKHYRRSTLIFTHGCLVQAPGRNATLVQFLILALYTFFACLYRMLPHLSFFSSLFRYLSPPVLIFPFEIDPLRFHAGCRKRQLNLALVFCVYFVL